jgi:hypothetical protein
VLAYVAAQVDRKCEMGPHVDIVVLVFLNYALGVLICVERVHENEWDIDLVSLIQVFDLSHGEI